MASQLRQRKQDDKDKGKDKDNDVVVKDDKNRDNKTPNIVVEYISAPEVFQAIVLLLILSVSAAASKAVLNPLYGPVLSANWFRVGAFITIALVSLLAGRTDINNSSTRLLRLSAILSIVGPFTGTFLARKIFDDVQDSALGPLGPLVVQCILGFPVLALGGAAFLQWMNRYVEPEVTQFGLVITTFLSWFALANCFHYVETVVWGAVPWVHYVNPSFLLVGLGLTSYFLPVIATPSSPTTKPGISPAPTLLPTPILVLTVALALYVPFYTASPPAGLTILAQSYSMSGFIQVADNYLASPPFRYLRRDAGVLGGTWLDGEKAGEPISTSSTLVDAVRLITGFAEGKEKSALVIGLGTGTTASSLISNSFNTTIIESDPTIYTYALQHFSLPLPHTKRIAPASAYISQLAHQIDPPPPFSIFDTKREELAKIVKERGKSAEEKKRRDGLRFDVVVHDLIWGGAGWGGDEGEAVWMDEFWEGVKVCVRDEGVVVVNIVSVLGSFHMQSILTTLLSTFPTCRLLHASPSLSSSATLSSSLTDYVIFCSPSSNTLTFRSPTPSDFSTSTSKHRLHTLTTLSQREIPLEQVFESQNTVIVEEGAEEGIPERKAEMIVKTNDVRWKVWKNDGAVGYWNSIRSILPPQVWKTY